MNKPLNKPLIQFSNTSTVLACITLLLVCALIFFKCKQNLTNPLVSDVTNKTQKTTVVQLNDSIRYIEQDLLIAETQKHVHFLESALQREMFRKIKIGKATTSIEFRDSIVYINVPGKAEPENQSGGVANVYPLKFKHKNNYLQQSYTVLSEDSSNIDSLQIIGKGHIIIGEAGSWYQKKTMKIGIMNENPYYNIDSVKSVIYKPKERIQLTMGPIILLNQKSVSVGAGVTVKKGIFSLSVGYKVF